MNKRNPFGRRKTDWIIPAVLFSLCAIAAAWALYNRMQAADAEQLSKAYKDQAALRERQLKNLEKQGKVK